MVPWYDDFLFFARICGIVKLRDCYNWFQSGVGFMQWNTGACGEQRGIAYSHLHMYVAYVIAYVYRGGCWNAWT